MGRSEEKHGDASFPSTAVPAEPVLNVGVSAWIIQDGNYGEFAVGQHAKFALEFGSLQQFHPVDGGPLGANNLGGARHHVLARVMFVAEEVWVIDAGSFMAYSESAPEGVQVGGYFEGDIYVGIDPFFYFEKLHQIPNMPALSYRWLIQQIQLETTPWRDGILPTGTQVRERDDTRESYVPASATDAWHDDDGHGHYILACIRQSSPESP
jgi:hypothetical protein